MAAEFDQFIHAIDQKFTINEDFLRPLTVVLLNRDKDFAPYKPFRPDGKTSDVAGFFGSRETWSVIGLSGGFAREETRRTIFHEGVHWFTDAKTSYIPLWLQEGLAEVFSTFRSTNGKARWGYTIPAHTAVLKANRLLPLQKLVTMSKMDPVFSEGDRSGIFYAESWAFVHFLIFEKSEDRLNRLNDYIQFVADGVPSDDAFVRVFGATCESFESDFETYLRRGNFSVSQSDPSRNDYESLAVEEASPAVVRIALSRLALASGHLKLAKKHAKKAVDLDPENPGGHELLAWIAVQEGQTILTQRGGIPTVVMKEDWPNVDQILNHCKRAADLGSTDAWTYLLLGYHCNFPGFLNDRTSDATARYAIDQYKHAITLRPNLLMPYRNLAIEVGLVDDLDAGEVELLEQGRRLFPRDGMIVLGLGTIAEKEGNKAKVGQLLSEATGEGMELIPAALWTVKHLESWLALDSLDVRTQALLAANDISGALDLYDIEIARAKNVQLQKSLKEKRLQLMYETKTNLALDAMTAGNFEAALRHLREMLQWDGLTQDQRESVIENLKTVNRKHLDSM